MCVPSAPSRSTAREGGPMRLFLWIFLGRAVAADLQVMYFNTDGTEHRTMAAAANTVAEIFHAVGISLVWDESPG